jgi:prepilin-type N-terminal cleavage/methylation domain-containing protein
MMRLKGMGRREQRGDTLVEVLICVLIVSMILTGAFVTTNRSTIGVRDSQEHAEALKLVQSQLEQVRQNAAQNDAEVFDHPVSTPFCMVNGAVVAASGPTAVQCVQNRAAQPTTDQPAYRLTVSRATCTVGVQCHQFTVRAAWDSIATKGEAMEQIIYRLHE